jgi:hypothetical protein
MRRVLLVQLLLGMLLALGASPALARNDDPRNFKFSFSGTQLVVFAEPQCTPDTPEPGLETCTVSGVFAREGRAGRSDVSELCAFEVTFVRDMETGMPAGQDVVWEGCTDAATFEWSADLSSATASGTVTQAEQVCTFDPETGEGFCEPTGATREVTVTAVFSAETPPMAINDRQLSHSWFDGEHCMFRFSARGTAREGTVTLTVEGVTEVVPGGLLEGRFSDSQRCSGQLEQ